MPDVVMWWVLIQRVGGVDGVVFTLHGGGGQLHPSVPLTSEELIFPG